MVWICTGAITPTFTNPGWRVMSMVRNTGASVSPCLFVQPLTAIAASATEMQRTLFMAFMRSTSLRPEDPGRDEDQQLVMLFGASRVTEQVPEDGDLPESRNHVVLILVVDLEDAADDRRAAVANENLAAVLANRQGHVLAERKVQGDGGLALGHLHVEQDRSLVRDLGRDRQAERRIDVNDGGR